jgi:hypothetical protein
MSSVTLTTPDVDDQDLEEMCSELQKVGIKVSARGVAEKLNRRFNERFLAAHRIQLRSAKLQGERKVMRDSKGSAIGEVTQQIHPVFYHALRRRFGAEALKDDGFARDLKKHHPELAVRSRSDRLTIVKPEMNSAPNKRVRGRRGRWAL